MLQPGGKSPESRPDRRPAELQARGKAADETASAVAPDDDEHKQRPPEFSIGLEALESMGAGVPGGSVEAVEGRGGGDVLVDEKGEAAAEASAAASVGVTGGTLDLHYADPGIVGPWALRLVQRGLCDGLVERSVLR